MTFQHLKEPIVCPSCGNKNASVSEWIEKSETTDPFVCASCGKSNKEAKEKAVKKGEAETLRQVQGILTDDVSKTKH